MLPSLLQSQFSGNWEMWYNDQPDCAYSLQVCIKHSYASNYVLDPEVFLWRDGVQIRVYMDPDEFEECQEQMEMHEPESEHKRWHETHFSILNLGITGFYVTRVGSAGLTIREAVEDAVTRWKALMLIFNPHVSR